MQRQRGGVLEGSAEPPKEHDLWETGQEGAFFSYDNKCYEVKEEMQQNAPALPPTQVQGLHPRSHRDGVLRPDVPRGSGRWSTAPLPYQVG